MCIIKGKKIVKQIARRLLHPIYNIATDQIKELISKKRKRKTLATLFERSKFVYNMNSHWLLYTIDLRHMSWPIS